jgi:hypothetical protein
MKVRVVATAILLGLLWLVSPAAAVGADAPYMDAQGRFSFRVPDGFAALRVDPASSTVLSFGTQQFPFAGFVLSVRPLPAGKSLLEDVVPAVYGAPPVQGLIRGPDGLWRTMLGGCPALRFDMSFLRFERSDFVEMWASVGGNEYALTIGANERDFAAFLPEVQSVLDSFAFLSGAGVCNDPETTASLIGG